MKRESRFDPPFVCFDHYPIVSYGYVQWTYRCFFGSASNPRLWETMENRGVEKFRLLAQSCKPCKTGSSAAFLLALCAN